MNTDDLIRTLAVTESGERALAREPAPDGRQRCSPLAAVRVALTVVMMGVRPHLDLADAALTPGGAAKFFIALAFAGSGMRRACACGRTRRTRPPRCHRHGPRLALAAGALSAIVARALRSQVHP